MTYSLNFKVRRDATEEAKELAQSLDSAVDEQMEQSRAFGETLQAKYQFFVPFLKIGQERDNRRPLLRDLMTKLEVCRMQLFHTMDQYLPNPQNKPIKKKLLYLIDEMKEANNNLVASILSRLFL